MVNNAIRDKKNGGTANREREEERREWYRFLNGEDRNLEGDPFEETVIKREVAKVDDQIKIKEKNF